MLSSRIFLGNIFWAAEAASTTHTPRKGTRQAQFGSFGGASFSYFRQSVSERYQLRDSEILLQQTISHSEDSPHSSISRSKRRNWGTNYTNQIPNALTSLVFGVYGNAETQRRRYTSSLGLAKTPDEPIGMAAQLIRSCSIFERICAEPCPTRQDFEFVSCTGSRGRNESMSLCSADRLRDHADIFALLLLHRGPQHMSMLLETDSIHILTRTSDESCRSSEGVVSNCTLHNKRS